MVLSAYCPNPAGCVQVIEAHVSSSSGSESALVCFLVTSPEPGVPVGEARESMHWVVARCKLRTGLFTGL